MRWSIPDRGNIKKISNTVAGACGEPDAKIVGKFCVFGQMADFEVFFFVGGVAAIISVEHFIGGAIVYSILEVEVHHQFLELDVEVVLQVGRVELICNIDDVIIRGFLFDDVPGRQFAVVQVG